MVVLAGAKVFLQCVAGSVCQSHDSELLLSHRTGVKDMEVLEMERERYHTCDEPWILLLNIYPLTISKSDIITSTSNQTAQWLH